MTLPLEEVALWEGESPRHWARRWRVPELHILARTDSTNDVARRLADHGSPTGTTVIAEEQTAGRGRHGRSWVAPFGTALLLSVILRPPAGQRGLRLPTVIPIRLGLAAARAIEQAAHVPARLKWPNDVIVPGAGKVAGILCEGALGHSTTDHVVAGIGINVHQRADDWPAEVRGHATSLDQVTGARVSRAELADALMAGILRFAATAGDPLDAAALDEYATRDLLRGARILVDDRPAGTAAGITSDGALVVNAPAGRTIVRAGTVRIADPANDSAPVYPVGRAPAGPAAHRLEP